MIFVCYSCGCGPCIFMFKGESGVPELCPFGFKSKWVEVDVDEIKSLLFDIWLKDEG